jgi:uncharacterized protein with NAD-binding domain and iron-sulfur cluster
MTMSSRKKVVILGGGVAGMSAAHELIERGFEVQIFERKPIAGGKARSLKAGTDGGLMSGPARPRTAARSSGPPLPGEHGFRFFPGFYRHVIDTMARIPYGTGNVAQNLVDTRELMIAAFDRAPYLLPSESPRSPDDVRLFLLGALRVLSGRVGVSTEDTAFFAAKLWEFLTSCEERRLVELERINWWDFIEAGSRSAAYQKFYGNGITRSLVAAKARRASSKTIGDIFLQILFDIPMPDVAADRVLNGPTNDVWIDPWLKYLQQRGVDYCFDAEVRSLRCRNGRVLGATVSVGGRSREVTGDYFIAALPVERMTALLSDELVALDPSLSALHELTEYVEWMNGIQFYLTEDVRLAEGHTIYIDSPWALTSISQPQFWKSFDLSRYGDGAVKGLLSVDISDWDVKGLNGKEARHCSRAEIAAETWAQLKRSLNADYERLRDDQLHSWFLDPGIDDTDADRDPSTPRVVTNAEPLLVNYVDTWRLRPEAVTRIPNFFLASDYVRTFTDLATMEAANEAARRAVNGVLRAARASYEPCRIWNLHEPEIFAPLRAYDRVRYRKGLGWGGELALPLSAFTAAHGALSALPLFDQAFAAAHALVPDLALTAPQATKNAEEAAAEARASSDTGLRRLRIVESAP